MNTTYKKTRWGESLVKYKIQGNKQTTGGTRNCEALCARKGRGKGQGKGQTESITLPPGLTGVPCTRAASLSREGAGNGRGFTQSDSRDEANTTPMDLRLVSQTSRPGQGPTLRRNCSGCRGDERGKKLSGQSRGGGQSQGASETKLPHFNSPCEHQEGRDQGTGKLSWPCFPLKFSKIQFTQKWTTGKYQGQAWYKVIMRNKVEISQ